VRLFLASGGSFAATRKTAWRTQRRETRAGIARQCSGVGGGRNLKAWNPYYLLFFARLVLSFTVVFGFFFTVDCFTKRPVIALRPRLPPLDFDAIRLPSLSTHT
jgi:hypothetical protein